MRIRMKKVGPQKKPYFVLMGYGKVTKRGKLVEVRTDKLAKEEADSREHYVEETVLETDLALMLPDHYISDIAERIALYRELDEMADEEGLQAYEARLVDRFGPLPQEAADLLETIRLRWMAQVVGFGKLVLKGGKLIGVFHDEEGSEYYRGVRFQRVLDFMQRNNKGVQIYQRNNALRLRVEPVEDLEAAMSILRRLSGTSTPSKPATASPGPQGPGEFVVEED